MTQDYTVTQLIEERSFLLSQYDLLMHRINSIDEKLAKKADEISSKEYLTSLKENDLSVVEDEDDFSEIESFGNVINIYL